MTWEQPFLKSEPNTRGVLALGEGDSEVVYLLTERRVGQKGDAGTKAWDRNGPSTCSFAPCFTTPPTPNTIAAPTA
jgi:hypothetical protein